MKPSQKPSELEALKLRVGELEARLNAFVLLGVPQVYQGHHIARCQCRRLVTRIATIRTKFNGTLAQLLCDECDANGPLVPGAEVSYAENVDADELAHIRNLNRALTPALKQVS